MAVDESMTESETRVSVIISATKLERRGMNEDDSDLKVEVNVRGVQRMAWCMLQVVKATPVMVKSVVMVLKVVRVWRKVVTSAQERSEVELDYGGDGEGEWEEEKRECDEME